MAAYDTTSGKIPSPTGVAPRRPHPRPCASTACACLPPGRRTRRCNQRAVRQGVLDYERRQFYRVNAENKTAWVSEWCLERP